MLKVGLVGYGFMGETHGQAYALLPEARVAGAVDTRPEKRARFTEQHGAPTYATLEEMLEKADPDIVDVCLPTFLHRDAVVTAAAAGKHVLCEKPIALTLEDADAMIGAAEKTGVSLMVGQVLRFWPEYRVIRELVEAGAVGAIRWAGAHRLSAPPEWAWDGWLLDPRRSGGAVVDLHIHDLDFIAALMGPPAALSAVGLKSPTGSLDTVFTILEGHPGGGHSYAVGSLAMPPGFPFCMALSVAGETGTIELDTRQSPTLRLIRPGGEVEHPPVPAPQLPAGAAAGAGGNIESLGGYFIEIQYFVDCVRRGVKPTVVTPQDARLALALSLAAKRSAETGQKACLRHLKVSLPTA